MTDPYRTAMLTCPSCPGIVLREYRGRYVCDNCGGMQIGRMDLVTSISELVGREPTLELIAQEAGKRVCPRCPQLMTSCHLRILIEDKKIEPRPEVDDCPTHGIWFDSEELAKVLTAIRHKFSGGGGGGSVGYLSSGGASGFGWWPPA